MNEYILKEEERLCEKYHVPSIDYVLDIQRKAFKRLYENNLYKKIYKAKE